MTMLVCGGGGGIIRGLIDTVSGWFGLYRVTLPLWCYSAGGYPVGSCYRERYLHSIILFNNTSIVFVLIGVRDLSCGHALGSKATYVCFPQCMSIHARMASFPRALAILGNLVRRLQHPRSSLASIAWIVRTEYCHS